MFPPWPARWATCSRCRLSMSRHCKHRLTVGTSAPKAVLGFLTAQSRRCRRSALACLAGLGLRMVYPRISERTKHTAPSTARATRHHNPSSRASFVSSASNLATAHPRHGHGQRVGVVSQAHTITGASVSWLKLPPSDVHSSARRSRALPREPHARHTGRTTLIPRAACTRTAVFGLRRSTVRLSQ